MACNNDVTDKLKSNAVGSEELAVNIKRLQQLTKDLRASTDCDALKAKLGITGDELKDLTKDIRNEAKELLEKYLPITKFPTNPLKIIPWVKKLVTGSIMPQLEAYIKLMQQVIQLIQAVADFAQAAAEVVPKIEQCAVDTINQEIQGAVGVINQTIFDIVNDIRQEIDDAICKSGIADLVGAINDAKQLTNQAISDLKTAKSDIENAVDDTLTAIGNVGNIASNITNVSFDVDTSSVNGFLNSIEGGAFQTFQSGVKDFLAKEPAKISSSSTPTIVGNSIVGSTLSANSGTWEGDDVTISYQWYRDEEPIYGATAETYVIDPVDEGKTITCQISGDNVAGGEFANTTATATVTSAPPEVISAPTITGTAAVGSTLGVSTGTWDSPGWAAAPTFTYQWQWAHVSANIYGATSNTYTIDSEDVGHKLTCIVTATISGVGNSSQRATPTTTVTGNVAITGTLSVTGNITSTENVTANSDGTAITLVTHRHSGVSTGSSYTSTATT